MEPQLKDAPQWLCRAFVLPIARTEKVRALILSSSIDYLQINVYLF